ncbi:MAG: hypothetical protein R2681_03555 [Pyrinomonadaceae bacterium]
MTTETEGQIKLPAIGLIVAGILNFFLSTYFVLSIIIQGVFGQLNRPFSSDEERLGFYAGFYGIGLLALIGMAIAPVLIYGGMQMMKGKKYGLARTASILAIIPATSCCFLVGLPVGIWSFITLRKPEVKNYFARQN